VAGPSGAGKGTLVRRLRAREPDLWVSRSLTTRERRPEEVDGLDYDFVTRVEFARIRDAGGFLEWFEVFGDWYGTPLAPVEEHLRAGRSVVLEIDVQGALAVRAAFPEAVLVFVRPPSRAEQRRRLIARDRDESAEIERRLAAAVAEEARAPEFDHVVVNSDADRATDELQAILHATAG
jgi:guanylate kinase